MAFLLLYYAVLVNRNETRVNVTEILLYIFIAGFAYDEFGEWNDAGQTSFYASDFWWIWDIVGATCQYDGTVLTSAEHCGCGHDFLRP